MKIIINQDKELRAVGYNELSGFNPLETEFYIAKVLNPIRPIHCIIDNRFHLLMFKSDENDNYLIYKPFDLVNIKYQEGNKKIKVSFNNEESKEIELFCSTMDNHSLLKFLGKEV